MTATLIISTYNWPQALELVLLSVLKQTQLPDEIIVADDGSTGETATLIEHFKLKFSKPLIHVWHEDDGFRKSVILNKAIAQAKGEYIIQADGDFKSDFIAVNGYNEDFKGWGREDSELAWRFHNFGLLGRRIRYRGIVFHIYHDEKSKDRLNMNDDIEKKTVREKLTWTENGINKYLTKA